MRLISLKASGYRQFLDPITLQIPSGLIGICGPNGVGKSKLIEAIGYALYGPASAILPSTDHANDLASQAGKAIPRVELEIEIRGQHYVICRTTRGKTSIQLHGAASSIADGASGVTQKVIELLRLSADAFCGTFVARQNEVAGLQSIDSNRRRRIVNRLIGIEQVEYAIHLARESKASRDRALAIVQAKLQMSSADAQQQLDAQQAEHATAIEAQKDREREVEALGKELETAQAQSNAIVHRQVQVAQYQEMIEQLAPAETPARSRVQRAKERLETVQAAARALAEAETTIQQTAEVPIALAYYDVLITREDVLERQQRLGDQLAQRADLAAQLAELNADIEQLAMQIGEYDAAVTQAEGEATQSRGEAEKQERRRDTVAHLGPDGVCDACGQILGDSYQQALQRHMTEAIEARGREQDAKARAQTARDKAATCRQERAGRQKLRDGLGEQYSLLDSVPGQAEAARDELAHADAQLAAAPPVLREVSYSAVKHEELRQAMERYQAAVATVEQQRVRVLVGLEERGDLPHPLDHVTLVDDLRLRGDAVGDERLDLTEAQGERRTAQARVDRHTGVACVGRADVVVAELALLRPDDGVPAHVLAVVDLGLLDGGQVLDLRRDAAHQEVRLATAVRLVRRRHRRGVAVGEHQVQLLP